MLPSNNPGFGFFCLPGGIFLKMLFWKIHDFFRITSTSHKFFEKDLFTIVFAMSTESYFSWHLCLRIIIDTQLCRFYDFPWAIFPVVNWRRDLPNYNCPRVINLTMKCYYPRPLFTVVKIPAKPEFTFDSLCEGALLLSKLERLCSIY